MPIFSTLKTVGVTFRVLEVDRKAMLERIYNIVSGCQSKYHYLNPSRPHDIADVNQCYIDVSLYGCDGWF